MEIVISVAAKIAEYTVAPIGRQLGYLCFYNANVAELQTQNTRLGHAKGRLQRKVEKAEASGEVIEADVKECLTTVGRITSAIETFTREEEQANTKCSVFGPKFPNLVLRRWFSRKAEKMAQKVFTQIQEVEKFKEVSYLLRQPTSSATDTEGYVEFETRKQNLRDVMEALKDPNIGKVGVWGMAGVGKTMLAKEIARRSSKDEEKLFTQVIFITISQTPNLESIRQDILNGLGMGPMPPQEYEDRLRNRLSKEEKVLVVVDDVWDKFDLRKVGISFGDDKKGCKILLTSRNQHVLESDMDVHRNFLVGVLLEPEAINLFHKTLGKQAADIQRHDDDDFQRLTTKIVGECGGLPIAITTVGSALKNKSIHVWKNALRELQNSNPVNIQGVHEKVYSSIKLTYDFLASEEAKELLLLCGLFPEDANMDVGADLCTYAIGLNLFDGAVSTLGEARNRTFTLVGNLKDHSLLLDGTDTRRPDCVKLHDVIRDIVIFIASKFGDGHGCHRMHTIRNVAALEAYFDTGKFKDSKAISLYLVDHDQNPRPLNSPELKILKVQYSSYNWRDHLQLGHQFFGGLVELLVLDLQKVALEAFLPASSFGPPFPNLRTLRLNFCKFGNTTASWIGDLKSLRILDLSNSDVRELPTEVGNLNRLLSLRLNNCSSLEVIQPNVLSRLTHLEDLELPLSFENWEKPDPHGVDSARVGELNNLRHLTSLRLVVRDVNLMPKDMRFSKKLENYDISIASKSCWFANWIKETTSTRALELDFSHSSSLNEHDFTALLKRSDALSLSGLKSGVTSVAYELYSRGFPQLKHLALSHCAEIRCILDDNYLHHHDPPPPPAAAAFPSLERLALYELSNLENIIIINNHEEYQKQLTTTTTFGKLSEIELWICPKLRSAISLDNINPRQLKKIEVVDCEMIEQIITITTTRERDGDGIPKYALEISHLHLSNLTKLVQFTATANSDDSDMPFFNGQVEFPKLERLQLELLYCPKIWSDQLPSSRLGFQSLTTLEVISCDNLKGLIPSSMIESDFVNLKTLSLGRCKAMEEVVFTKEYSAHDAKTWSSMGIKKISFPKLEDLQLYDLSKLERFCAWNCVDFPSLIELNIRNCPKLGAFITSSIPTTENENEDSFNSVDNHRHFDDKNLEFRRQLPDNQQSGGGVVEGEEHDDDDDDMVTTTASSSSREAKGSSENGYSRDIFFLKTSFQNLRTLKVTGLHDVTSLFYSSAIPKSLSQLSELCIRECDSLRHVVVFSPNSDDDDDDDDDDGGGGGVAAAAAAAGNNNGNNSSTNMVFSKLKIVVLDDLPNLTSFFSSSYSGNNNDSMALEVPLLNKLAVGLCPRMTIFSHPGHHIVCPSLRDIIVYKSKAEHFWIDRFIEKKDYWDYLGTRYDSRQQQRMWEGDINSTIQKLNLAN